MGHGSPNDGDKTIFWARALIGSFSRIRCDSSSQFLDEQIGDGRCCPRDWSVCNPRLENVTIRELSDERIAGSCFAWICDIYFALVSLGPSGEPFSAPTQALAVRAGSLESD